MVDHRGIESFAAVSAQRIAVLLTENLLVKASKQTLIVDTHSLEEAHLEFLAIATQLGCQAIPLALKHLLGDVKRAKLL